MGVQRDTQFSLYKITNMHILFAGDEESKKFGCTGEFTIESEVKKVVKNCEGVEKESRAKVESAKAKFVGHVEKDVLRKVYGIDTKGLKPGVYAYGVDSLGGKFSLTAECYDLFETDKLLIAMPVCSVTSGIEISIKNGEDTVAEIELEFSLGADENSKFYYEGFASEISTLTENWHKKFDPKAMVQAG